MDIRFSGNARSDCVTGMIPHQQGAIDMAKVVLEHERDPATPAILEDCSRIVRPIVVVLAAR